MPIFETKVISPLALRFTQEHIRTTFRCGRTLEETVEEIRTLSLAASGRQDMDEVDGYDLILQVPFPLIEIIRWRPSSRETKGEHWYTLDNRRLYCLQTIAVEQWPKRVGVAVDILYADPGDVKKKFDSTTFGSSTTVSPSCKHPPLFRWDWRASAFGNGTGGSATKATFDFIMAEDKKATVDKLVDAPGATAATGQIRPSGQTIDTRPPGLALAPCILSAPAPSLRPVTAHGTLAKPSPAPEPAPSPLVALLQLALAQSAGTLAQGSEKPAAQLAQCSTPSSEDSGTLGEDQQEALEEDKHSQNSTTLGSSEGNFDAEEEEDKDIYELSEIPLIAKGLDLITLLKLPPLRWETSFLRSYEMPGNKTMSVVVKADRPPPQTCIPIAGSLVYVRNLAKHSSDKDSSASSASANGNAEQSKVPFNPAKLRNEKSTGHPHHESQRRFAPENRWRPKGSA